MYEPMEQKADFVEVIGSSNNELRAKSYEGLIDLKAIVSRFGSHTPGMLVLAVDQEERIDDANATKRIGR